MHIVHRCETRLYAGISVLPNGAMSLYHNVGHSYIPQFSFFTCLCYKHTCAALCGRINSAATHFYIVGILAGTFYGCENLKISVRE